MMGHHEMRLSGDLRPYYIELHDPPANCVALAMAPPAIEELLKTGHWLVMLVAAWSTPDIRHIDVAIRVARRLRHIMVGVRPFDSEDEVRAWLPSARFHRGEVPSFSTWLRAKWRPLRPACGRRKRLSVWWSECDRFSIGQGIRPNPDAVIEIDVQNATALRLGEAVLEALLLAQ
jgi:hypothetical protein